MKQTLCCQSNFFAFMVDSAAGAVEGVKADIQTGQLPMDDPDMISPAKDQSYPPWILPSLMVGFLLFGLAQDSAFPGRVVLYIHIK